MLGGAGDRGVERVDVHVARILEIARHQRALEEMDVIQRIDRTSAVV